MQLAQYEDTAEYLFKMQLLWQKGLGTHLYTKKSYRDLNFMV